MTKPFFSWDPTPGISGAVVTTVRDFPNGFIVVLSDDSKSTICLIKEGEVADTCGKVVRKQPVKVVDVVFSSNLWKIVVLYEDFALHFIEPSNGRVEKSVFLKQGLNKASRATAFAMHPNGSMVSVAYVLDRTTTGKKNKIYEEDDAISYCIDLIDMRSPAVPLKCYEDLHSASIQSMQFSCNILMTGGADGLVNWVDTNVEDVDEGLLATNSILSPVATVGFTGSDAEGRSLAFATTDDGLLELYRIVHGSSSEEFDVEVTFKRNPSERFLVNIVGNGNDQLPYVIVESTCDGRVVLTATSIDGKFHQIVGDFKDHQDLVRCVHGTPSQRLILSGDESGRIVGRKFSEVENDKIEEITETMERMEVNVALPANKPKMAKKKRKGVMRKISLAKTTGKVVKKKLKSKTKKVAKKSKAKSSIN